MERIPYKRSALSQNTGGRIRKNDELFDVLLLLVYLLSEDKGNSQIFNSDSDKWYILFRFEEISDIRTFRFHSILTKKNSVLRMFNTKK